MKKRQLIGRHYFDREPYHETDTILLYPGFQTEITMRYFNGIPSIILIADPISKIINKTSVYEILCEQHRWPNLRDRRDEDRIAKHFEFKGVYTIYNKQHHIIKTIDFTRNIESTFTVNSENGEREISFRDYFSEKYGQKDLDPKQPLIIVEGRRKQEICLVPELCVLSEISAADKNKLPMLSSFKPQERITKLKGFIDQVNTTGLEEYMRIEQTPVEVMPRYIDPPSIELIGSGDFRVEGNFKNKLNNMKWPQHVKASKLIVLVTHDSDCGDFAREYTQDIQYELERLNSPVQFDPEQIKYMEVSRDKYHSACLKELRISERPASWKHNFIHLAYISFQSSPNYNDLKNYSISNGILTQVIKSDGRGRSQKKQHKVSILRNIVIQIISKMGSTVWRLSMNSFPPSFSQKNIMVIGIDVYHSTNANRQRQSVGVLVASFITARGTYKSYIESEVHEVGEEIMSTVYVQEFVKKALQSFRKRPDILVVYRDGVAESQISAVIKTEFNQVIDALIELKVDNCQTLYTIVQKRIHVRYTATDRSGLVGNPPPGSVINEGTLFYNLDDTTIKSFYLISTSCNLSTVKPIHYIVLEHHNHPVTITMEELQQFTHYMTYLYPNWTDSVKLPYVTQIAHKTCHMLGEATPKYGQPHIGEDIQQNRLFSL